MTINQAIKEIRKVFQSCNILNIAELVEKNILETRFICNEYIGFMDGDVRLKDLQEIIECKPIHDDLALLISGEVKELEIEKIEYKSQEYRVLIKNRYSDWSLEKVQEQLQSKFVSFKSMGFELSHTVINKDILMIDSKSLYEYLDFKPEKLLNEIDDLKTKLELNEKEILLLRSKGVSAYSTPALDVTKAVINEFWEDWTPESNKNIKQNTIKKWIGDNFPDFQSNAIQLAIDQICRNPKAKTGGINRSISK